MSLSLIHEIWKLLKPSIETGDIDSAAEMLVNFIVEEDHGSTTEIKNLFRSDKEIKNALDYYIETPEDSNFHNVHEEDEDDDPYDDYHLDDDEEW